MAFVNENFLKLPNNYLFSEISRKVSAYKAKNPDAKIIRLGIGDVTQPLAPACIEAMHKAVDELAVKDTFRGYGPEQGYDFLVKAIIENDFEARGVHLDMDEVFVSDGAKSDCGNIGDIFSVENVVGVSNPAYPVYVDSNVMAGRAGNLVNGMWDRLVYNPSLLEFNFEPQIPTQHIDYVYICNPNNPTGTIATRETLKKWIDYAIANDVVILYDAAYEAYIQSEDMVHSIYEIEGAKKCAIEFRSYSKTAGFTGVRCGFIVVPKELMAKTADGKAVQLNPLWNRRHCTKFNGASYITQCAAAAIYTPEGKQQTKETIDYYMTNAKIMREALAESGLAVYGGEHAPYLWVKTPEGMGSWEFFDQMLEHAQVVCTPGVGFGSCGEGFIRITAFGDREASIEAMGRINQWLKK